MAMRPIWKGSLKLSLISIPVRVFPATNASRDVSFRQLHRKCHTPIQLKKWCPHCEEDVGPNDIVKGYESAKGQYVIVTEEEIAALRPESTHVVDISHVLPASAIDPIYVERSYFLAPDGKQAASPFAVLREALGDDQAGVGHVAIHGREYLVGVIARDPALVMHTLRTAGEVRDIKDIDMPPAASARTRPDEVKLARQVLNAFDHEAELSAFIDHYEDALRRMVASKASTAVSTPEAGGAPPRVVNLMDALRKSLATVQADKKTASRRPRRQARVLAHPSTARKHRKAS